MLFSRPALILAAVALARIGFGYQYQTVATLGPDLMRLFGLDYATLGTLIGAFMLLGGFVALPLRPARRGGSAIGWCWARGWRSDDGGPAAQRAGRRPGRDRRRPCIAGVGAVAMIVLQNKVIADWFTGRRFMWAISVSVARLPDRHRARAAHPAAAGCARIGWQAAFLSDAVPMAVALVLFLASFRPAPHAAPVPRRFSLPSGRECLLLVIAGLIWTAYTGGLFRLHRLRAVDDGGARREPGADRPRADHRHLGQRSGDACWAAASPRGSAGSASSCSAPRRWSSA